MPLICISPIQTFPPFSFYNIRSLFEQIACRRSRRREKQGFLLLSGNAALIATFNSPPKVEEGGVFNTSSYYKSISFLQSSGKVSPSLLPPFTSLSSIPSLFFSLDRPSLSSPYLLPAIFIKKRKGGWEEGEGTGDVSNSNLLLSFFPLWSGCQGKTALRFPQEIRSLVI